MVLYTAKHKPPKYALRFWEELQAFNQSDTPDRSGIVGIERQLWSTSLSTGIDWRDLCQETFVVCASKFKTYRSGKSALNTWIRWQSRMAATILSRHGTKHTIIEGKQAEVRVEIAVAPNTFSGEHGTDEVDSKNGRGKLPFQDEIDEAIAQTYNETDTVDNKILLDTAVHNGHTLRELGKVLLKHGKTKGIPLVAREWGITPTQVKGIIERMRVELSGQ